MFTGTEYCDGTWKSDTYNQAPRSPGANNHRHWLSLKSRQQPVKIWTATLLLFLPTVETLAIVGRLHAAPWEEEDVAR